MASRPTPQSGENITSIRVDELIAGASDYPNRHVIELNNADKTATIKKGYDDPRSIEGDTCLQVQAIQAAFDEMAQSGVLSPDEVEDMRAAALQKELDKILPRRNGLQKVAAAVRRANTHLERTAPRRQVISSSIGRAQRKAN